MILFALLLQVAPPTPGDIVVQAPPAATPQTPATIVVEPAAMMIATLDADADGRTTRAEMDAGLQRSFEAIDTARAGALRYLVFAEWAQRFLGDRNALPSPFEIDRDGDGRITPDELREQFGRLYARFNRNGDEAVSRAELLTFRTSAIDAKGPAGPGERRENRRR